jgi:hypothetical protein
MDSVLTDFHGSFGNAKTDFTAEFDNLSRIAQAGVELVDELVQVLADATPSNQDPQGSLMQVFLNSLMKGNTMDSLHGSTEEQENRPIYEVHDDSSSEV